MKRGVGVIWALDASLLFRLRLVLVRAWWALLAGVPTYVFPERTFFRSLGLGCSERDNCHQDKKRNGGNNHDRSVRSVGRATNFGVIEDFWGPGEQLARRKD